MTTNSAPKPAPPKNMRPITSREALQDALDRAAEANKSNIVVRKGKR